MAPLTLAAQLLQVLAAGLLMISFAMLSQRRSRRLIILLAWQGVVLTASTLLPPRPRISPHLYYSAALTLVEKVWLMPWILMRLMRRLGIEGDSDPLVNIPTLMLAGLGLC